MMKTIDDDVEVIIVNPGMSICAPTHSRGCHEPPCRNFQYLLFVSWFSFLFFVFFFPDSLKIFSIFAFLYPFNFCSFSLCQFCVCFFHLVSTSLVYSWSLVIFSFDNCLHKHQTSFLDLHCFFNHQARVCKRFFAFQFMMKIILIFNKADRNHQLAVWWHKKIRPNCDVWVDKTQCQLCKRLAEPFIPLSWSCLVSKRVSLWMWSPGGSQQPFSCVLGPFSARWWTTNLPTGWS